MRHALGFLLGVVLTPAIGYAAGWGASRALGAADPSGHDITDRNRLYGALAVTAATGLVIGVVIVARWASPLVTLIPALAFLGWTAYLLIAPRTALDLPSKVPPAGEVDDGMRTLLTSGTLALLGLAMFVPTWIPWRWRPDYEPAEAGEDQYF